MVWGLGFRAQRSGSNDSGVGTGLGGIYNLTGTSLVFLLKGPEAPVCLEVRLLGTELGLSSTGTN